MWGVVDKQKREGEVRGVRVSSPLDALENNEWFTN